MSSNGNPSKQIVDPQLLRSFIMYDVLSRRPTFDGYKNFCEATLNPKFDYVEYEYWYYKFYSGSRNMEDERSPHHKPKQLVELPVEILDNIFKKVERIDLVKLCRMNKAFNRIANWHLPKYGNVEIFFHYNRIICTMDGRKFVHWIEKKSVSDGRRASVDELIQKLQKPDLKIYSLKITPALRDLNILSSRLKPNSLHVKSLVIENTEHAAIYNMLTRIKPGVLEQIRLGAMIIWGNGSNNETGLRLMETEQWRRAKCIELVKFGCFSASTMDKCLHLEQFEILVKTLSENEFLQLRNKITTAPNFKSCRIYISREGGEIWKRQTGRALGADIPNGDMVDITHQYLIPDSRDTLMFNISNDFVEITKALG